MSRMSAPSGAASAQAAKTAPVINQQQILLRLPDDLTARVRKLIGEGSEAIDVEPQQESDKFIVKIQGDQYPALLANLPTNVETHKTFDNKIFLKSGDIGQVLIVFKTEKERDKAESSIVKTVNGEYLPDGLTFPTKDIVKRKFELTRKAEPYPVHRVRTVMEEIRKEWISVSIAPASGGGSAADEGELKEMCETVYEEVVDFEDWMVSEEEPDGITIEVSGRDWMRPSGGGGGGSTGGGAATAAGAGATAGNGGGDREMAGWLLLQEHPEILIAEEDVEEDKDREAYEQLLKEAAAAANATTSALATDTAAASAGPATASSSSAGAQGEKLSLRIKSHHHTAAAGADSTAAGGEEIVSVPPGGDGEDVAAGSAMDVIVTLEDLDIIAAGGVPEDGEEGHGEKGEGGFDKEGRSVNSDDDDDSDDDQAWLEDIKKANDNTGDNNANTIATTAADDTAAVAEDDGGGGGGNRQGNDEKEEVGEEEEDDDDNAWMEEVDS